MLMQYTEFYFQVPGDSRPSVESRPWQYALSEPIPGARTERWTREFSVAFPRGLSKVPATNRISTVPEMAQGGGVTRRSCISQE